MTASRVVAMFGLSGVGKGWLARELCERHQQILHLEASALMRAALNTTGEALRTAAVGVVQDNQSRLVQAFIAARSAQPDRPVLFDGHSVIDNDLELVEVPVSVVAALGTDAIVFVFDDPTAIRERRLLDDRRRPDRPVVALAHHQERARAVAVGYAERLNLEFHEVTAGDWQALERAFFPPPGPDARD